MSAKNLEFLFFYPKQLWFLGILTTFGDSYVLKTIVIKGVVTVGNSQWKV